MNLTIFSSYPPRQCGVGNYTRELVRALLDADRRIAVTVLAEKPSAPIMERRLNVWGAFSCDTDYVQASLQSVDLARPDLIHIQHEYGIFGMDERFLRLLGGLRKRNVPTVVTMHTVHTQSSIDLGCGWWRGMQPMAGFDPELYQVRVSELADRVIVHQEAPIRQVLMRQGAQGGSVVTIPHGTSNRPLGSRASSRALLGIDSAGPLLAAFGYFERCKNTLSLIRAFAVIKEELPDARLWLGGYVRSPNPEVAKYRRQCEEEIIGLGLESSVVMLDRALADEEVPLLFASADVACFVYDEDTRCASGAAHTALGFGVPIVASRTPKFHEFAQVSDEILVNPKDPDEIARIAIRLIRDRTFRSSIIRLARCFAEMTSWTNVAELHLDLYRQLAKVAIPSVIQDVEVYGGELSAVGR